MGVNVEVEGELWIAQAEKPKRVPVGKVWPVERVKGEVVTRTLDGSCGGVKRWLSFRKLSSFQSFGMLDFLSFLIPSPSTSWPSSSMTCWISSRSGWICSG